MNKLMLKLMNNAAISWIRTAVPVVVGAVAVWLSTRFGVEIDTVGVTAAVIPVVSLAYYTVVRWLEKHWSKVGWLLGVAKQPVYSDGPVPAEPLN